MFIFSAKACKKWSGQDCFCDARTADECAATEPVFMARNRKRPTLSSCILTDQQRINLREFGTLPSMRIGDTIRVKLKPNATMSISEANDIQRALNAENSARMDALGSRFMLVDDTGRLIDDGMYPTRVTSGRERSTE